jgi:hypothetical protein|tara:strand:- start:82 stop:381 length:300 start_codon:yes stop_codon:yes gene_type:complete
MSESISKYTAGEATTQLLGGIGFKRLAAGTHVAGAGSHTDVTEFYAIKAVAGLLTFGAACVAVNGDAPANTDTLLEGVELRCRLTTIVTSSGISYAYFR